MFMLKGSYAMLFNLIYIFVVYDTHEPNLKAALVTNDAVADQCDANS